MSLEVVQERLNTLLEHEIPKVVLLSGGWGSGKTHQWKEAMARANKAGNRPKYAYVSLFGLASLAEARKRITEEAISSVTLPGAKGETVGEMVEDRSFALKPMQILKLLPVIPYLGKLEGLANELSFSAVKKAVICFDDLERCAPTLRVADIFGLASFLKEERDCRVILISNQEKLREEGRDELKTYMEKVVDEAVHFAPTPAEACAIALGDPPDVARALLRDRMANLKVSNIRVISRLGRMTDQLAALFKDLHAGVVHEAIHSLAIFGAGHFLPADGYPPPAYLFKFGVGWKRLLKDPKPPEEQSHIEKQEAAWDALLEEYGWSDTSALDIEIGKGVVVGYFDKAELLKLATHYSKTVEANALKVAYDTAWRKFWQSIAGDSQEMLKQLRDVTAEAVSVLGTSEFCTAYELFVDAGDTPTADALLDHFVEQNKWRPDAFEADDGFGRKYPDEVVRRFADAASKVKPARELAISLDAIDYSSGWNPDDVRRVAQADFEQVQKLLMESEGRIFLKRLKTLLRIGTAPTSEEAERALHEHMVKWLKELAASNPILALRIKRFIPADTPPKAPPAKDAPAKAASKVEDK